MFAGKLETYGRIRILWVFLQSYIINTFPLPEGITFRDATQDAGRPLYFIRYGIDENSKKLTDWFVITFFLDLAPEETLTQTTITLTTTFFEQNFDILDELHKKFNCLDDNTVI